MLGPLGLWFSGKRIRKERIRKAKEALTDLVEGMLVSQEEFSAQRLRRLYAAVEREIDVSLGSAYDPESLIEDVMLRFERSRHLDTEQKQRYLSKLEAASSDLTKAEEIPRRPMVKRNREILDNLMTKVKGDTESESLITELRTCLQERPPDPFTLIARLVRLNPKRAAKLVLISMAVYIAIVIFVVILTKK